MTTEPTLEAIAAPPSDLAELHDLVVGDAITARTFDVDPAAAEAIAVVVPNGWRAEVLDPADREHLLARPRRATGRVRFADPAGFAAYVIRHLQPGTTVWAHHEVPRVVAVLNDHAERAADLALAGWGDHRAELELIATEEWRNLLVLTGGGWTMQREFAERLEEVAELIETPEAATVLDLVNNLVATSSRRVVTADVTGNSSSVTFEAASSVKGVGGVDVPSTLIVRVHPWRYLPFVPQLKVRVRARVHQDALQLRAQLVGGDRLAEAGIAALGEHLHELGTPPLWVGTPR